MKKLLVFFVFGCIIKIGGVKMEKKNTALFFEKLESEIKEAFAETLNYEYVL